MTELLTAAQMRELERAAIDSGAVTGLELMERAGRGVVEAVLEWRPELALAPHRAVVLCGPGNNGGDGFVVARLFKERGWEVEVFLYGDEAKLPPDAAENCRRWREMGEVREKGDRLDHSPRADIVIDALFGIGLSRPIDPHVLQDIWDVVGGGWWPDTYKRRHIVSIDLPSGICSDSGKPIQERVADFGGGGNDERRLQIRAGLSVTFGVPKIGHHLADGPEHCGKLVLVDLGIDEAIRQHRLRELGEKFGPETTVLAGEPAWEHPGPMRSDKLMLALRGRQRHGRHIGRRHLNKSGSSGGGHKFSHGHALILSGPMGRGGAARLAARGALRIGAGLVTVGCPPGAVIEHAAHLTAIMLRPVADAAALAEMLGDERLNALCLGPGLGVDDRTRSLVLAALDPEAHRVPGLTRDLAAESAKFEAGTGGPGSGAGARGAGPGIVLDADALTAFAGDPETLFAALHEHCVLTPHAGEFRRLFPDIHDKLAAPATKGPAYSKVDATREAAARAGCTVLFKGADTVIADQTGRAAINSAHYERAAPWLATAGAGDVLAGFIAGLLARGFAPMQAAETASWLHVECARSFGPGLIAEDLPEELPKVFRDLGL